MDQLYPEIFSFDGIGRGYYHGKLLINRTRLISISVEINAYKDLKKALPLNLQKDPHFEVDEDFEKLNSLCK